MKNFSKFWDWFMPIRSFFYHHGLTIVGLVVTYVYFDWLWGFVGGLEGVEEKLKEADLNNLGDFLAGSFGPLMLFWLIIGYFQQQIELGQNTKALSQQAEELANAVEVQQKMLRNQVAPAFSIDGISSSKNAGKQIVVKLPVVNSGSAVDNVQIVILDESLNGLKNHPESHVKRDEQININLVFGDDPEEMPDPLQIVIYSRDSMGGMHIDSFNLKKHGLSYTSLKNRDKVTEQLIQDLRNLEETG